MATAIFLLCSLVAFGQSTSAPAESIISLLKAGKYQEARESVAAALKQSPGDARLWTLNAVALNQLGNKSEALQAYNHALQISPAYLPALEGAAEIEYQEGSQRAVPLLEEVVKMQPEGKTAHAMLGTLAFKRSDCKTAVEEFGRSEPLIHSQVSALQQYGACLVKLNGLREAIPVFERIAELRSADEKARYNLALVQSLAGRSADVIRTLSSAAPSTPTLSIFWLRHTKPLPIRHGRLRHCGGQSLRTPTMHDTTFTLQTCAWCTLPIKSASTCWMPA